MITPKKALGQHWLHDTETLYQIAEIAKINPGDHILEIGPGLGTLTEVLLSYEAHVVAVEYDTTLFESMKSEAKKLFRSDAERLTMVNQDILKFDLTKLPSNYKVVANIPYYLTSNLIRVLSESTNPPLSATLLIQKEVAERLCASPGQMSLLSVSAQMYFECSPGPVVPAKLFTPPPKVDSQIVHLKRRASPLFGGREERGVFRVIKAGFSSKRKTLLNSLSAGLQLGKEEANDTLIKAGINPSARPQELSIEQWLTLFDITNK